MRFRTFALVVVGFGLFFAALGLFYGNRALMAERFALWPGRTLPVWGVLLLVLVVGLAISLGFSLARESRLALERWREGRARREQQAVDALYAEGVGALLDGRPAVALERFRAILARSPRHVDALVKAGEVLRTQGRLEEATELHTRAHRTAPEELAPLYALVADADARGDVEAARHHLSRIVELKPREAVNAMRHLRDLHIGEGRWDEALELQDRLDKVRAGEKQAGGPDDRVRHGLRYQVGRDLALQGRHKEAQQSLRRLLKDAPGFVPAWKALGESRRDAGDEESAVATWMEGYEKTHAPVLLTTLEDHFLSRERPERAIEIFRRAVASSRPDTVPRFFLGKLYYRLEMLDEALAAFRALQDRAAYAPTLAYYLARIHERRGRHAEANTHYRRIILEGRLLSTQYRCLSCDARRDAWADRCSACGEWNRVQVDFREDVSLEELGISSAPVYSAKGG